MTPGITIRGIGLARSPQFGPPSSMPAHPHRVTFAHPNYLPKWRRGENKLAALVEWAREDKRVDCARQSPVNPHSSVGTAR